MPNDDWYANLVLGNLEATRYDNAWEEVGTVTASQASAIFKQIFESVMIQNTAVGQVACFAADNMQYINQDPTAGASQWLKCEGQSLSQISYFQLYDVIGTTFGGGTGVFSLPDLRGRVLVDAGSGVGLTPRALGDVFGEETHTLSGSEMPIHTHSYLPALPNVTTIGPGAPQPTAVPGASVTGSAGLGAAHNNLQPSIALFWYIQAFP